MRAVIHFLTRTRFLIFVLVSAIIVLSWRGLSGTAAEVQRYENLHHAAVAALRLRIYIGRDEEAWFWGIQC